MIKTVSIQGKTTSIDRQFTISNTTPLSIENTPDYTNVDLYDGHGKICLYVE